MQHDVCSATRVHLRLLVAAHDLVVVHALCWSGPSTLSSLSAVAACAMLPGVVVVGAANGSVTAWRWSQPRFTPFASAPARTFTQLWQHCVHTGAVRCVWLSEDGRFVMSGADDHAVVRVDASGGEDAVALRWHTAPVTAVASSFDGTRVFSASEDGTVGVWAFT
jgi:WD40 repeat protein